MGTRPLIEKYEISRIAKPVHMQLIIKAPLVFVIGIVLIKFVFHRSLDWAMICHILGVVLVYVLIKKNQQLSVLLGVLERSIAKDKIAMNRASILSIPKWSDYRLKAFNRKIVQLGIFAMIVTIFLRIPLETRALPLFGLYLYGMLLGFSLLLSFKGYIQSMYGIYIDAAEFGEWRASTKSVLPIKRYFHSFFVVFIVASCIQYIFYPLVVSAYAFSMMIAVVAAMSVGVFYVYKALYSLLNDIDAIRHADQAEIAAVKSLKVSCDDSPLLKPELNLCDPISASLESKISIDADERIGVNTKIVRVDQNGENLFANRLIVSNTKIYFESDSWVNRSYRAGVSIKHEDITLVLALHKDYMTSNFPAIKIETADDRTFEVRFSLRVKGARLKAIADYIRSFSDSQ